CPPVVSYTTLSPLPLAGRSSLCGTVSRIAPGGCYPPPCPVEPGRSSVRSRATRPSGRPARSSSLRSPPVGVPSPAGIGSLAGVSADLQIQRHVHSEPGKEPVRRGKGRRSHSVGDRLRLVDRAVHDHLVVQE